MAVCSSVFHVLFALPDWRFASCALLHLSVKVPFGEAEALIACIFKKAWNIIKRVRNLHADAGNLIFAASIDYARICKKQQALFWIWS